MIWEQGATKPRVDLMIAEVFTSAFKAPVFLYLGIGCNTA